MLCWTCCTAVCAYEYEKGEVKISLSGYLEARSIYAFDRDTPKEYPTTELGLEYKTSFSSRAAVKIFLQAVDDGTVLDPQNGELFHEFNKVYQDRNPYINIDEAYVDFYSSNADVRIGIQKFAWGRLDEINPTDNLNSEDLTQGAVNDEVERKIGVPSVKVNMYSDAANLELAWIPWFVPYRLPIPKERWFPGILKPPAAINTGSAVGDIPVTAQYRDIDLPDFSIENSEAGIRVSKYINGWDVSLSYFTGYDPMPLSEVSSDLTIDLVNPLALDYTLGLELTYEPALHRMHVFGFDFTTTVSSVTVRGEYAYFKGKHYNRKLQTVLSQEITPSRQEEIIEEFLINYLSSLGVESRQTFHIDPEVNSKMDSMRYGLGIDYIYGDTSISGQFIQEFVPNFDKDEPVYFIDKRGLNTFLTILFKQFFLQNTMELNLRGAYGIEFQEYLIKPSLKYSFTNTVQGVIGVVILGGKKDDSLLGQYEDNDEFYAQLRCSF